MVAVVVGATTLRFLQGVNYHHRSIAKDALFFLFLLLVVFCFFPRRPALLSLPLPLHLAPSLLLHHFFLAPSLRLFLLVVHLKYEFDITFHPNHRQLHHQHHHHPGNFDRSTNHPTNASNHYRSPHNLIASILLKVSTVGDLLVYDSCKLMSSRPLAKAPLAFHRCQYRVREGSKGMKGGLEEGERLEEKPNKKS